MRCIWYLLLFHLFPYMSVFFLLLRLSLVYADGSICLDILQNQWSPIYDIAAILTSLQSLLCDPNPNSPANSEAARLYQENKREYYRRVKEIVEKSWESVDADEGAGAESGTNQTTGGNS